MLTKQNKNKRKQKQPKNMFSTFTVTFMLAQVVETNPVAHMITEYLKIFILFQLGNIGHV